MTLPPRSLNDQACSITTRLCTVLIVLLAATPAAASWSQWLGGPHRARAAHGTLDLGLMGPDTSVLGRELWRVPYGSGYSSVSVVSALAVSARADKDGDFVTAHDAMTGAERWRFRLEDTYEGHDGSHDGPLSTPAIARRTVFAISARGRLVALDTADGALRWERDLVRQDRAKAPSYGFASSPLVAGDMVLVQGGKRGDSLMAFDQETGEKRWGAGKEAVRYSSPALMVVGDEAQVVVATNKSVLGVRLADGTEAWRHPVAADDFTPLPLGNNRVFISGDSYSFVLEIVKQEKNQQVKNLVPQVLWRTGDDEGAWGPVMHDDGMLYAQDGDDNLLGADATTGEVLWRREAVNGTTIRVGTFVFLLAYGGGDVHLFEATRKGARNLGVVASLEQGQSHVRPSFSDGPL